MSARSNGLARRSLVGFVLTFIAARIMVLLIMARRVPNFYFFLHGTHVHHLNYGIFLLSAVSGYLLFAGPSGRALSIAALLYGAALALTFDEFGMWLHLGGSYWQRASVDAVIVVAAILLLIGFASDLRRFEARHWLTFSAIAVAVVAFAIVAYDASLKLGQIEAPKLHQLELDSSP